MKNALEPAKSIIERLGGEFIAAKIAGTKAVAPYRWQYERMRGGTGGLIPQRHHPALLAYARLMGIALSAEEFLPVNAACSPSVDNIAAHTSESSTHPIRDTGAAPAGARKPKAEVAQ